MPPSKLHWDLTNKVPGWIGSRTTGAGYQWAAEVSLSEGYVADAVAIASLQGRFWLQAGGTYEDAIPERLVFVFETKVSQSDFNAKFGCETNRQHPIGNLHYVVIPPTIDFNCLPEFWGVIQQSGRGLRELRPARLQPIPEDRLWHAAYRVLLASRRNHQRLPNRYAHSGLI